MMMPTDPDGISRGDREKPVVIDLCRDVLPIALADSSGVCVSSFKAIHRCRRRALAASV
jgi:hypothetical protein